MSKLDRLEKAAAKRKDRTSDEWRPRTDDEKTALVMAFHWLGFGVPEQLWDVLPDEIRHAYERNDRDALRDTRAPNIDAWAEGYVMPDGSRIVPILDDESDMVFMHRFPCVCNPEHYLIDPGGEPT